MTWRLVRVCMIVLLAASASCAQNSTPDAKLPGWCSVSVGQARIEWESDPPIVNSKPCNLRLFSNAVPAKPMKAPRASFWLAAGAVYGAAFTDMYQTRSAVDQCARSVLYCKYGFHERDPLARPFVQTSAPVYYASGFAVATGVNWLAWKMSRSRRWHRVWWLPQLISVSANTWGIASSH
jgi:hypothetical protein